MVVYVPEPGRISIPSSLPSTKAHAVMYVVVFESVGTVSVYRILSRLDV